MHLLLPVGASRPRYKDLKMVPSFSLPLSFSVSQMAILLTAAKKALHSTGHTSPGMFVELFELQPFPPPQSRRPVSFKLIQKWHCFIPRVGCVFSVQSTRPHRRCRLPGGGACVPAQLVPWPLVPRAFSHPAVTSPVFSTNDPFGFLLFVS